MGEDRVERQQATMATLIELIIRLGLEQHRDIVAKSEKLRSDTEQERSHGK